MDIILKLDNFEGPLDLLLHLIDRKKLKIQEVNILQLIGEYIEIIEKEKERNLELKVEFIYIATELLEIKALEVIKSQQREEKEQELKRRLEDYKIIKEVSGEIAKLEKEFNISYRRSEGKKIIKKPSREYNLRNLKQMDLFQEYNKFIEKLEPEFLTFELNRNYSLEEEIKKIYIWISGGKLHLREIFEKAQDRQHLIYIFLGVLEMYKDGIIEIDSDMKIGKTENKNV
ncbi:MAG: segregation and condensation protein A [Fusobacteriaceae bacterium]